MQTSQKSLLWQDYQIEARACACVRKGLLVILEQLLQGHCRVLHPRFYLGQRQRLHLWLACTACRTGCNTRMRDITTAICSQSHFECLYALKRVSRQLDSQAGLGMQAQLNCERASIPDMLVAKYLGVMQRKLLGEADTYLQPLLPASGGAADPQSPAAAGASDNTFDWHTSIIYWRIRAHSTCCNCSKYFQQ